jgi:PRC-barrel domain protein
MAIEDGESTTREPGFPLWNFRSGTDFNDQTDVIGYQVVGTDEEIGSVADFVDANDQPAFVVDTGAWVVGQRILLPAGAVESIDHAAREIRVDRTGTDIREAPPYEVTTGESEEYRNRLTHYYCDLYADHHEDQPDHAPPG